MTKRGVRENSVAREIKRQATSAQTRRFYFAMAGYEPVDELPDHFQLMLKRLDAAEAGVRDQDGRRRQE